MRINRALPQDVFPDFEFVYDGLIAHFLQLMGDKDLTLAMLRAQAWRESGFNPVAVSGTGCRGIFQFTRAAWADMDDDPATDEDRFDIFENAKRAVKLMTAHLIRYRSGGIPMPERWKFALGAFNQGAGNVRAARERCRGAGKDPNLWLNVHPFFDQVLPETRALEVKAYVRIIPDKYAEYLNGGKGP